MQLAPATTRDVVDAFYRELDQDEDLGALLGALGPIAKSQLAAVRLLSPNRVVPIIERAAQCWARAAGYRLEGGRQVLWEKE